MFYKMIEAKRNEWLASETCTVKAVIDYIVKTGQMRDAQVEAIKTYGTYLKSQGVPKEVSGNFETLLQAYTSFMNNYAKHRDATSNRLLEYLMYQTGNIIRLLITLKQGEDKQ